MSRTVDHAQHEQMALRALEAIRAGGVAGLTMARLARDLEVKRSTLYWYFGSLEEVFDAVLAVVLERQGLHLAEVVAAQTHPIDQLIAWIHGVHDYYGDDPELLALLVQLWAVGRPSTPQLAISQALASFEPLRDAAIAMLDEGVRVGAVRPCDPAVLVDLCAVTIDGTLVHRVSRGLDSAPVVAHFIATTLEPLRGAPAEGAAAAGSASAAGRRPGAETSARNVATTRTRKATTGASRPARWLEED